MHRVRFLGVRIEICMHASEGWHPSRLRPSLSFAVTLSPSSGTKTSRTFIPELIRFIRPFVLSCLHRR